MKITILNGDDSLGIDNVFHVGLDFSQVPNEINAVHWQDNAGVIEYLNSTGIPDESITELPSFYDNLKAQWDVCEAEAIKAKLEYEALLAQTKIVQDEINNLPPLPPPPPPSLPTSLQP